MTALFPILFIAPLLFSVAVLIDKVIVTGNGASSQLLPLTAVGGFFNLVCACGVGLWMVYFGQCIGWNALCPLMLNGITYWAAMMSYITAMKRDEASRVTPILQMLPVLGIFADIFILKNAPTGMSLVGIVAVMTGCLVLNLRRGAFNWKVVGLMIFATAMLAVNDTVFAKFGRELETAPALFADLVGKAVWGLLPLLFGVRIRQAAILGLRQFFWLFAISDLLAILADGIVDVGKLFFPISVVQTVDCTQELFTLAGVVILTRFFPRILKEELGGHILHQKSLGIAIIVLGGILVAIGQGIG